jgi:hypothetical protein
MAETVIIGTNGNVTLPTDFSAALNQWYLTLEQTPVETTNYGDSGNRTYRGGLRGGAGSATGFPSFDAAASAPGWDKIADGTYGAPAAITLTAATGCTYTGNVIVSGIAFGHDLQGNATITFNFVFSGAITETWDESA